jgi:hypothetical protein
MKLALTTTEECEEYLAQRFPVDSRLTYEEWKAKRDSVEKVLRRHGRIDRGGVGTDGDFSVADDWVGARTVHICTNTRKIVSTSVFEELLRLIGSSEPEYGVTLVGTYPQVLLSWTIALTQERKMIAFGPTFDERLRDQADDPEVEPWVKALDALWK